MAELSTLIPDIYKLFDPKTPHIVDEGNLEVFCENLKQIVRSRFLEREEGDVLRFSSLGRPDRQIWYMAQEDGEREEMSPKTYFKFLYGDIIEQMVLFLVKEAGHTVEQEQAEIEVEGVKGHIDAIIDGVVVDVKSASPYSFTKFTKGTLFEDDPFGYVHQISGYANVLTPDQGAAFLAFNKVDGDMAILNIGTSITSSYPPAPRIEHLKEVIASPTPPERCHSDVEDGKSGNRKLNTPCSYCGFKKRCWPELRTFLYGTGPRYLTEVHRVPDVYEVKNDV